MTHSKIFLYACISFISGIFIGSFLHSYCLIYFLLIISIAIMGILWKRKHVFVCVFLFLIVSLGFLYVNSKLENILNNEILNYVDLDIEVKGKAARNPKDDLEARKVILKIYEVNGNKIDSSILISTNEYLNYGDHVVVFGKLILPENFNNFNYRMYLANQGVSAIIRYPKIEIISRHHSLLFDFKNKTEKIVLKNLSINKASILNATVLGETDNMNSELKQNLGFTGISHVVAISGTHIVLLCMIMLGLLNYLKIGRRKAIVLTFLFLLFYIVLIEFPASALRAFIMMSFVLLAELIGRESDSLRSLVMAALLILIFNPLALIYDLGFQLSFLAVLGIIFFNNYFKSKLNFLKSGFLIDIVAVNFSAQVFVLPLLIHTFQYISLSSFITNILIVPMSLVLLVLGFLSVVFSLIFPSLSFLFFAPISLMLEYALFIVNKFAFMILKIDNFPLIFVFLIYLILSYFALKLKKDRFEFYF